MNEFLRNFVMTCIRDMIKRNVALYQTYQYASGWFSKGVLLQEDLEEVQRLYEEKNIPDEVVDNTEESTEVTENSADTAENTDDTAETENSTEVDRNETETNEEG